MRPRLGHIQFLNCLPLYYGLVKNDVLLDVDLVKAAPRDLARMLLDAELDIAPIPAIEYARHAHELVLLPEIAISSDGEVQSILLLSKRPAEELSDRTVALTDTSRTSQVLARILLERRWRVEARYAEMPPDLPSMLREADAAMLIGDDALRAYWQPPEGLTTYDLGNEWTAWTGLPMVYAVWAVRRAFAEERPEAVGDVADALMRSLAYCRAHLGDISEYASRWEPFAPERFRSYFDALSFRFGPRYRDGLMRYLAEAQRIGQLESVPELSVFGEGKSVADGLHELALAAAEGEHRLGEDEALSLLERADMLDLGAAATVMRDRLHPGGEITFIVDRNINYTNVCVSGCRFCAFYRDPDHPEAYVIAPDELHSKVEETLALGGTAILLQGGMHPELSLEWYEQMLRDLKARYAIHVHGFGPPEVVHLACLSGLSVRDVLVRLRDAGLDSLPGGGAEILVDRVRARVSPHKASAAEWLGVMREAHLLDMSTTATMMFGGMEALAERIEHLSSIRKLQDRAVSDGHVGFRAFIPWSFQPTHTALETEMPAAASGWQYLRILAVSRLFLDNIANIQASWVTQGAKIGQVALAFGANDMGSTMIEENVVAAAGTRFMLAREELVRLIREAGFVPVQRDTLYREVERT